jgi:hypothetical protein
VSFTETDEPASNKCARNRRETGANPFGVRPLSGTAVSASFVKIYGLTPQLCGDIDNLRKYFIALSVENITRNSNCTAKPMLERFYK